MNRIRFEIELNPNDILLAQVFHPNNEEENFQTIFVMFGESIQRETNVMAIIHGGSIAVLKDNKSSWMIFQNGCMEINPIGMKKIFSINKDNPTNLGKIYMSVSEITRKRDNYKCKIVRYTNNLVIVKFNIDGLRLVST